MLNEISQRDKDWGMGTWSDTGQRAHISLISSFISSEDLMYSMVTIVNMIL